MSLDNIIGGFVHYQRGQTSNDDDWADRLSHIYTVNLLVFLALFVSCKIYVGNPIECFYPDGEFDLAKREYARSYCWLKNTYRLNNSDPQFPIRTRIRTKQEIAYYQWVPIILLLLAAIFKLPNLLWLKFSSHSGIDVNKLANMVISTELMPADKARDTMKLMTGYFDRWLEVNRQMNWNAIVRTKKYLSKKCFLFCFKGFGAYLTGLYALTKIMYLLICILVFFLMRSIFGEWFILSGYKLLPWQFAPGETQPEIPFFPKVTFCDIQIWQLANLNTHTLQCTLPINLINEKIFALLWIWFWIVSVATGTSFVTWLTKWIFIRSNYVYNFLNMHGDLITDYDRMLAEKFCNKYLRRDGTFVLKVLVENSNSVVMSQFISDLWRMYKGKPAQARDMAAQGDVMYI